MTTHTNIDHRAEALEAIIEAGFIPIDEFSGDPRMVQWMNRRYDGFIDYFGLLLAVGIDAEDERLRLDVLTSVGSTRAEVRFDITDLGLTMFAGAVDALIESVQ